MAIVKLKKVLEDLENNTSLVVGTITKTATSAGYAGTSYKATSSGVAGSAAYAGTSAKATSAGFAGTSSVAAAGTSGSTL